MQALSDDVIVVYVEATSAETESRLLISVRRRIPALANNLPLKETLTALRQDRGIPSGKKVLIVLGRRMSAISSQRVVREFSTEAFADVDIT